MKKYVRINVVFREYYDADAVLEVLDNFSAEAELNGIIRMAIFYGSAERGQEFVKAIEAIEPISSITMKTYNY